LCKNLNPQAVDLYVGALYAAAEHAGQHLFRDIEQQHRAIVDCEKTKGQYSFGARRRAIEGIGLPSVREHRLSALIAEETVWRTQMNTEDAILPDLYPLVIVRVEAGDKSG